MKIRTYKTDLLPEFGTKAQADALQKIWDSTPGTPSEKLPNVVHTIWGDLEIIPQKYFPVKPAPRKRKRASS